MKWLFNEMHYVATEPSYYELWIQHDKSLNFIQWMELNRNELGRDGNEPEPDDPVVIFFISCNSNSNDLYYPLCYGLNLYWRF